MQAVNNNESSFQPKSVIEHFHHIAEIPRGSGNEKQISDFLVEFAHQRGYDCIQDNAYNVLIRKDKQGSISSKEPLVLQTHLDMVCEKEKDVSHDFESDPIKLLIRGSRMTADGTTLGADAGIGIALILAILDSSAMDHPPIEALFTVREETDFFGVEHFDYHQVTGKRLINFDSYNDGTFVIGSAGGIAAKCIFPITRKTSSKMVTFILEISNLIGGHSGKDIDAGRANANELLIILLNRFDQRFYIELVSILGGESDNSIARNAQAIINLKKCDEAYIQLCVKSYTDEVKSSYENEHALCIRLYPSVNQQKTCFTNRLKRQVLHFGYSAETGVIKKSEVFKDTVEVSNNLGIITTNTQNVEFLFFIRSLFSSSGESVESKLTLLTEAFNGKAIRDKVCMEWAYNFNSLLQQQCRATYLDLFESEPAFTVEHAGLECGVIKNRMDIDVISMGPNCGNLHSPWEWLDIQSVDKIWIFLISLLKSL